MSESNSSIETVYRKLTRLFHMVHELHKIGYQGLRITTQDHNSYRYFLSPSFLFCGEEDLFFPRWTKLDSRFTNANGYPSDILVSANSWLPDSSEYFNEHGWTDSEGKNARQLANMFVERFPKIAAASWLEDFSYAGWLTSLIGEMEHGWYPWPSTTLTGSPCIRLVPTNQDTVNLMKIISEEGNYTADLNLEWDDERNSFTGDLDALKKNPIQIQEWCTWTLQNNLIPDSQRLLGPFTQIGFCEIGQDRGLYKRQGEPEIKGTGIHPMFPLPPAPLMNYHDPVITDITLGKENEIVITNTIAFE